MREWLLFSNHVGGDILKTANNLFAKGKGNTVEGFQGRVAMSFINGLGKEPGVLGLAVVTVAGLLERRLPTLVCCGAGLSRSPVVAAAALALALRQPLDNCLKAVAAQHPVDVAPGLWHEVKDLFKAAIR